MGLGFAILFHIVLFIGLYVSLRIIRRFIKGFRIFHGRLGGIIFRFFPVCLALVPLGLFTAGLVLVNVQSPKDSFRSVFGTEPAESIRNLQGTTSGTNDAKEVYLAFNAVPDVLRSLIATSQFETVNDPFVSDLLPMPPGDNRPQWWKAGTCTTREVFRARHARSWNDIVVTNCNDDDTIYVQARWTD